MVMSLERQVFFNMPCSPYTKMILPCFTVLLSLGNSSPPKPPAWGSFVGNILPFSEFPRGKPSPCGKFFISVQGFLFRSYQHMNEQKAQEMRERFNFKASA